jgi:hypothetical protein
VGVRHSRSPLKTTSRLAATPTANSKAGKTVRGVACASRPSQYHFCCGHVPDRYVRTSTPYVYTLYVYVRALCWRVSAFRNLPSILVPLCSILAVILNFKAPPQGAAASDYRHQQHMPHNHLRHPIPSNASEVPLDLETRTIISVR